MDPSEPASTDPVAFPNAAKIWWAAVVLGIGLAATSAVQDRAKRRDLERVYQTTSVGDKAFFPILEAEIKSLRFAEAPLLCPNPSPDPMIDSKMIFVGQTDDKRFRLYVPAERVNGQSELGGPSWYLKTGQGQFLRVTR